MNGLHPCGPKGGTSGRNDRSGRRAVGKIAAAIVVVAIIVIAAAVGVYYASTTGASSSTQSSSAQSSASSSSSSLSLSKSLVIDSAFWPLSDGDLLATVTRVSYPLWTEDAVYQSLIEVNVSAQQNLGKLQLLPGLAQGWTVSPNGMTLTFNLRPGATFSNGDPFNAYVAWVDFYMWYYVQANASTFWSYGLNIFNMSGVNFGLGTFAQINASGLSSPSSSLLTTMENQHWPVYVTSSNQIVYNLDVPFPFFLNTLARSPTSSILDPLYIIKHGGPGPQGTVSSWFDLNPIPGTGPYVISEIHVNSYMVFTKSPNYWGDNLSASYVASNSLLDPGHFNSITVYFKPDDTSRYVDLSTNGAQVVALTASTFQLATRNPGYGYAYLKYPAGLLFMVMNNQLFPTNITAVRQAIVHAINYSDIIKTVVFGNGSEFMGPETPNFGAFYDPGNFPPYAYNVTLAESYLSEAGFPNGKGLPTLTFWVDSLGAQWQTPAAEIIQTNLAAIGIKMNILVVTDAAEHQYDGPYQTNLKNAQMMPSMRFDDAFGYAPDYLAPTDYWVGFVTNMSGWGNYAVYNNPIVDKAVAYMETHNNVTTILQQMALAQQQIYNDAPYAWMFLWSLPQMDGSLVYNKQYVGGFYLDPNLMGFSDIPIINTIQA